MALFHNDRPVSKPAGVWSLKKAVLFSDLNSRMMHLEDLAVENKNPLTKAAGKQSPDCFSLEEPACAC